MAHFSLNIRTCCSYVIWEARSNLGKKLLHPQKYALPYTYDCECWIPIHCDATIEWERSGKVRNHGYLKALWRNRQLMHMQELVAEDTSDAALFVNIGDLDEILQLGISDLHSTFCKSQLLASADIWHFVVVTWHSNLNLRPQNASPGTDVSTSPWLRHCLQNIIISLLQVMHTAKYPEVAASYKNCHTDMYRVTQKDAYPYFVR